MDGMNEIMRQNPFRNTGDLEVPPTVQTCAIQSNACANFRGANSSVISVANLVLGKSRTKLEFRFESRL